MLSPVPMWIGLKFDQFSSERSSRFALSKPVIPKETSVKIRAGYDIAFQCPHPVPVVLIAYHPSRA